MPEESRWKRHDTPGGAGHESLKDGVEAHVRDIRLVFVQFTVVVLLVEFNHRMPISGDRQSVITECRYLSTDRETGRLRGGESGC